jgi:hypothetical protein
MKNKSMRDLQKHWSEQAKKSAKKAAGKTAPVKSSKPAAKKTETPEERSL